VLDQLPIPTPTTLQEAPAAPASPTPLDTPDPLSPAPIFDISRLPALAEALLNPSTPLQEIARTFNIQPSQLHELLADPALQQLLTNAAAIHDLRHRQRCAQATERALARLESLMNQDDPVESRRAAQAITRVTARATSRPTTHFPWYPTSPSPNPKSPSPSSASSHPHTPSPQDPISPSPLYRPPARPITPAYHAAYPTRALTPLKLIATALAYIKDPDHPDERCKLRNLNRFCTRGLGSDSDTRFDERFRQRCAHILNFSSASHGPVDRHGQVAFVDVYLDTPRGQACTAHFRLHYSFAGERLHCWLIDAIDITITQGPDPTPQDPNTS
jgi:hypothetical protein